MNFSIVLISVGVCLLVSGAIAGECCVAHIGDPVTQDNDAIWCKDYCCHNNTRYYCCDDINSRTDSEDRENLCADYFRQHVWVPVVIALGCVALIVVCFICCCCCCKTNCCKVYAYVKFK